MFRLISDVHGEQFQSPWEIPQDSTVNEKNVNLILAGDIGVIKRPTTIKYVLEDASERFNSVSYVMGNHEHYKSSFNETESKINELIVDLGVSNINFGTHFAKDFGDTVVIGASLWTDVNKNNPLDKMVAYNTMNDYSQISYRKSSPTAEIRRARGLTVDDTIEQHYRDKTFIFDEIYKAIKLNKKIVVVTHHAPSSKSVHPMYANSDLNYAFYSEMTSEIIDLDYDMTWCHGHMHQSFDYNIGKCKILCNPLGYRGGAENPHFNAFLYFD